MYWGNFRNGEWQGYGMYLSLYNTIYYGEFRNNIPKGEGVIVNQNGETIAAGVFVNGKMKYKGKFRNIKYYRWIHQLCWIILLRRFKY